MKRFISILLILFTFGLTACSHKEKSNEVSVGTMAGPETKLMQVAKKVALKEFGLHVRIVTFTDYSIPNQAVANGELDANAFQHYPFLLSHPQFEIAKKQMSMGGGIVTFEIKGGIERGRKFLDALQMCSLTANLGDTRTIATHPASTTHAKLSEEERKEVGITPGMVRISVGLENIIDIVADIEQALETSR